MLPLVHSCPVYAVALKKYIKKYITTMSVPMRTQRHFDDKKSSIFGCMVEIWLKLNLDCILSSKSRRKWLVVLQLFFDCILPIECWG